MTDPLPTLDVYGGWTSARLLIRILYAIDSPWDLTEAGLTHTETGETCSLQMRGRDHAGVEDVKRGESPVRPSLTEDDLEGLADHRSVIRVVAVADQGPLETSRAVLRCASALVDAGAHVVRCVQSGLTVGGEHLQALVRIADGADEADDESGLREALYLALVHPLRPEGEGWRTVGMGLLGLPDARSPGSVPEAVALDAMEALNLRALSGRAPGDGERVRAAPSHPAFRVRHQDDPRASSDPGYNPFGAWCLEASEGDNQPSSG